MIGAVEAILKDRESRRAMVVAHPDDETLWGAGLLLRHPGNWTVIACSMPANDPIRAWKFHDACALLGARGRLLPYYEALNTLELKGLDLVDLTKFDLVVTHNSRGEYGHAHHRQVHRHVLAHCISPLLMFGYGMQDEAAGIELTLSETEQEQKMAALRSYDHLVMRARAMTPYWHLLMKDYATRYNLAVERYAAL